MPEFAMLIVGSADSFAAASEEEIAATTAKVIAWFEEHTRSGRFVEGAGRRLQGPETATTVRPNGSAGVVTDGPFAETKEQIGGFAVLNAKDMDDAVEFVKSWPGLPGTKLELRPVFVTA
jgi:hypothetical protein